MTRTRINSPNELFTVPAFINKLWNMVEDPKTDDIICWSEDGNSVLIRDEGKLWYNLLPIYYKHNNISSFIRQLNMYGFRKIPNLTEYDLDAEDRVDHQFIHPFFHKGKVELLKNIKRKGTCTSKIIHNSNLNEDGQHSTKIFSDVKTLYNRQNKFDSIVSNLKQENAVLWRELAVLRQKHQKQQQIVNKLIQFLVTFVQPSTRLGGVPSKRRHLMIHGGPSKKAKSKSDGPTIHELDNSDILLDNVPMDLNTIESIQIDSPTSVNCENEDFHIANEAVVGDINILNQEPESELLSKMIIPEDADNILTLTIPDDFTKKISNVSDSEYGLLSSPSQELLLSDLMNDSYNNSSDQHCLNIKKEISEQEGADDNMRIVTCGNSSSTAWKDTADNNESHSGRSQNELEQIKKIFNDCNTVDAKYLLQLFNEAPSYGLTLNESWDTLENSSTISGTEVTPYDPGIDFSQLLDEVIDTADFVDLSQEESLNTPEMVDFKPDFSLNKLKNEQN